MKEKIIHFIKLPTDLQVAKFLEEQNFEMYGILEIPDLLKKTFEEQEIITFKKTWYYRDSVKKLASNIDLNYLVNFEKKI